MGFFTLKHPAGFRFTSRFLETSALVVGVYIVIITATVNTGSSRAPQRRT